jgi:arsenite methyltransferase
MTAPEAPEARTETVPHTDTVQTRDPYNHDQSRAEASQLPKADYGMDAPGLQLATRYGGVVAVVAGRMLSDNGVMSQTAWAIRAGTWIMWTGVAFFLFSAAMWLSSRVGKLLLRNAVLDSIAWRGDEQVLDVGCGHGLMLLGAARHLTSGHAVGVDVWSQRDQKNNSAGATMENARREGVAERVEVRDSDARELPFPENSFDVVVSSLVVHNISGAAERENAIREMARVLKPGGQLAVADLVHVRQYEGVLRSLGWEQTQVSPPTFLFLAPTRVLRAIKPDGHA